MTDDGRPVETGSTQHVQTTSEPAAPPRRPTSSLLLPPRPHWADTATFRWIAFTLGLAATNVMMFGRLAPDEWPHIALCILINVLQGLNLFRRPS